MAGIDFKLLAIRQFLATPFKTQAFKYKARARDTSIPKDILTTL